LGPVPRRRRSAGFTLIELLIVMVVFGTMSAYVVMRSTPAGELTLPSQAQKMASDIRRVQSLASSWGQRLRVTVDAGGYSVRCASAVLPPCPAATSLAVTDPATASSFVVALQKGVVFVSPTTATLDINSLGQPLSGASFTLSGGSSKTVVVAPLTGFVVVTP
jgi:prepilin-type N-terminal cleavage/methylation domain-containing protein